MGYGLGVDLGTTFTAAAVEHDGRVEMATLGDHTPAVPSVVLLRADGTALTGDGADRRAASEPDRVAREVKRRLGDPMPVILGGSPQPVQELMAMQLRDVVREISDREGCRPDTVTLTHPANWGPYKRELFGQIPNLAGLDQVRMLTEPEAAAAHYASTERVPDGAVVAVYDLGGGTFDATVLRIDGRRGGAGGFEILGTPEGIEGMGGIDFDEAVYAHVDRALDGALAALDPADVQATTAAIRLRQDCVLAKEALSADTETTIPVLLPGVHTEVRLTRGELEAMIRPSVAATVESMRRALRSAGVTADELHTVLLVGGSSRIPMVASTVSSELGRPTAVDAHPKHAIALGAATVGAAAAASAASAAAAAAAPAAATAPAATAAPAVAASAAGAAVAAGAAATAPLAADDGVPGDDTPTPPGGIAMVPPGPAPTVVGPTVPAVVAAAVPAGPETTLPTPVTPGPDAPAAGTPAPALEAPAGARRRRRVGIAVGAGVLAAAAAVGGVLFYGAASGTPAAPAASTSSPEVPAQVPAPAAPAEAETPAEVSPEPEPDTSPQSVGTSRGGVEPTPERVVPVRPQAPAPQPKPHNPGTEEPDTWTSTKTSPKTTTPPSTDHGTEGSGSGSSGT